MMSYKSALDEIKLGLKREIAFCNKLKRLAAKSKRKLIN